MDRNKASPSVFSTSVMVSLTKVVESYCARYVRPGGNRSEGSASVASTARRNPFRGFTVFAVKGKPANGRL
jgi:hypothetical protein